MLLVQYIWKFQIVGKNVSLNFLLFWTFNYLLATLCMSIKVGQLSSGSFSPPSSYFVAALICMSEGYSSMCPSCNAVAQLNVWTKKGSPEECPGSIFPLYFGARNCMKAECSTQYADKKGSIVECTGSISPIFWCSQLYDDKGWRVECTGSISPHLSWQPGHWPTTDHCVSCFVFNSWVLAIAGHFWCWWATYC